jgi:UDP-N-acetylglucosamine/UDP-N-acetylgalactosamine diphosphorylase
MPISETLRQSLQKAGQSHLTEVADALEGLAFDRFIAQLESLDLGKMHELVQTYVKSTPTFELPDNTRPASYYPADHSSPRRAYEPSGFRRTGERLLSEGKVACFTVAGGQGSRLGYDGPKGCYPAGAITKKSLFQFFAEGILATQRKYGGTVPWLIMTSPQNHEQTVSFFEQNGYFGLNNQDVMFFPQGTMPSFDLESGQILLAGPDELTASPDGHGGSLRALHVSGALDRLKERGVEHISYFQVDNPLVKVADPLFIGLHASAPDSTGEMSSKMLPKAYPEEKVGLFVEIDGRTQMVEYSDMPMELQRQTNDDGSPKFLAGNPAIHAFSVAFVDKVNTDPDFDLPYHKAVKKIAYYDRDKGAMVTPTEPNGVKLERFVFDALPFAKQSIILETSRVQEFAPIKNAEGVDSAESSANLQTQRASLWLESHGVKIPRKSDGSIDCVIEISPLTALDADDLNAKNLPASIKPGEHLAF